MEEVKVKTVEQSDIPAYTVKDLARIFPQIPHYLWVLVVNLLQGSVKKENIEVLLTLVPEEGGDLSRALMAWNWDSHAPHTDDAVLALVEELLEEYRDG
jgi:hypothetical protein